MGLLLVLQGFGHKSIGQIEISDELMEWPKLLQFILRGTSNKQQTILYIIKACLPKAQ